jgi:hypothetical protein
MDKALNLLVERLKKSYGDRLASVLLYGSAATGDHQAQFSDLNILCVLSEITTRELSASEDVFRWWRDQGSPAPLLLTEQELTTSTDCFTIELLDIKQNHRLLHGRDLVADLEVDTSSYRAQVERDLRAKLLRLRQKAAGMFSEPDLLRRLLLDSLSTFCVLFRHALALNGVDAPARKRAIIELATQYFAIDAAPFQRLLDVREERIKPREFEPVALLTGYLQGISAVASAVDRLGKQETR